MSHTFKDNTGAEWSIVINIATAKRLKAEKDVDLANFIEPESLANFINDQWGLTDALLITLEDHLEKTGLSENDFLKRLEGEQLEAAADAFLEAVVNFTRPAMRETLRAVMTKTNQSQQQLAKQTISMIQEKDLTPIVEREAKKIEDQIDLAISGK